MEINYNYMNYPPNFNPRELNIEPQDDLCEECQDGNYQIQYWWKDGKQLDPTGKVECDMCNHEAEAYEVH